MNKVKLIVAGGRDFNATSTVINYLQGAELNGSKLEIVSGMARGADKQGVIAANYLNLLVHEFPANWDKYGKSAGYRRNEEMAEFADALLAFWDGKSRGTKHMIVTMEKLGKEVHVVRY